jgi:hypothetical protein
MYQRRRADQAVEAAAAAVRRCGAGTIDQRLRAAAAAVPQPGHQLCRDGRESCGLRERRRNNYRRRNDVHHVLELSAKAESSKTQKPLRARLAAQRAPPQPK